MLLVSITKPKLLGPPVGATALANSMTIALQSLRQNTCCTPQVKKGTEGTWIFACVVRNCYKEGNTA